jgi:hypothetical protein
MLDDPIIFSIFLIFTGATLLAGLALFARQSMLVAYILLGGLVGPWGLNLVNDASIIQQIGHIGIIFLLFLLGLNLQPSQLLHMLREAIVVTVASSMAFASIGILLGLASGFTLYESVIIGSVMMFSSTIIGLKLLPTTALHHRHSRNRHPAPAGGLFQRRHGMDTGRQTGHCRSPAGSGFIPVRASCPATPHAPFRHHSGIRLSGGYRLVPWNGRTGQGNGAVL